MEKIIEDLNLFMLVFMSVAYFYHIIYVVVGLRHRRAEESAQPVEEHRFAALICARNERNVIAELIASLKRQNYPGELLDIFVLADNCTDDTAVIAAQAGAKVYSRTNKARVGKGFALNHLLHRIDHDYGYGAYDGFFVFDADNIVDPNFVREMNRTFSNGYSVVTSYRNSKNFASNWITYGYSVWFLFEARFVNAPRMTLHNGCAVSGTGFLVSSRVIRENGGWPFHLLTEDIQFSVNCVLRGMKIGYCNNAILYDEQPETFSQSWTQRMRWAKGFYQIDARYLGKLAKGCATQRGSRMTCYDILMTVAPFMLLSVMTMVVSASGFLTVFALPAAVARHAVIKSLPVIVGWAVLSYVGVMLGGLLTVLSEWDRIGAPDSRKLALLPTLPIFLATQIPIGIVALFRKVEWKPIYHFSSEQLRGSSVCSAEPETEQLPDQQSA